MSKCEGYLMFTSRLSNWDLSELWWSTWTHNEALNVRTP